MAYIRKLPPLEFLRLCFNYCDGALYWRYRDFMPKKTNSRLAGKKAGSFTSSGYLMVNVTYEGKSIKLLNHRIIYFLHNADFNQDLIVDHIDGNPANNDIENLRAVNKSDNTKNKKAHPNSKTGHKNIFKTGKKTSPYVVQISVEHYKRKHIGSFETLEEAILARDNAQEAAGYVR